MQSRKADRKISFEFKTSDLDPLYGTQGPVRWERLTSVLCEWQDEQPSRSEIVRAGMVTASRRARIRVPWRGDITSEMRVIDHTQRDAVYQIIGGPADYGGRRRQIELMVEIIDS